MSGSGRRQRNATDTKGRAMPASRMKRALASHPCEPCRRRSHRAGLVVPRAPECCVSVVATYAVAHGNRETVAMKNITVSVDEETHRLARVRAVETDTSVSALVRDYLRSLIEGRSPGRAGDARRVETAHERRRRLLNEVFEIFDARGAGLRMADNVPREALYDRAAARAETAADSVGMPPTVGATHASPLQRPSRPTKRNCTGFTGGSMT